MENKITKEELEKLQAIITKTNGFKLSLGDVEIQKHRILHEIATIETGELKELQDELEEAYGKVNVNIQDGVITEIETEDESDKED
tara:strand:+ start:345 stop:602 length:258 start_codon:yes stop_codon:yes gene_type:complete